MWTKQIIRGFIIANAHWIILGVIVLGLLLYAVSYIDSCSSKRYQKKNEEIKSNISQDKGAANAVKEQRNEANTEILAANQQSRNAVNNRNDVVNTDSGSRNASRQAAIAAFCREHPADSNCRNR